MVIKDNANQPARRATLAGKPQMLFDAHLVTKLKAVGDAGVQVSALNPGELRALILKFGGKDAKVGIALRRAGLRASRKFADDVGHCRTFKLAAV